MDEFLQYVREKNPHLAKATDEELSDYIREKYPQYADKLTPPKWQPTNTNPPNNNSLQGRENKVANAVLNPFLTIAKSVGANPEVGSMMDKFSPIPAIAKGVEKFAGIPSAPNWQTGASRLGSGMTDVGMGALQTLNPVPFGAFGAGQEALGVVSPTAANVLQKVTNPITSFTNPKTEIGQNAASAADLALQGVALQYGGKAKRAIGRGIESSASTMSGRAFSPDVPYGRTKELGKFAQEHGMVLGKENSNPFFKGVDYTKGLAEKLNTEINQKIIDPATNAGVLIDGKSVIDALHSIKQDLANQLTPDQASLSAIDKMIESTQERLTRTEVPNMLTPREAQDMKVTGNKILRTVYEKKQMGTPDEEIAAKKLGKRAGVDELRSQLEAIHPELKNVNWHEGSAIELLNSMQDYLNEKANGTNSSGVVVRGNKQTGVSFSIYDLLGTKPFKSKLAVVLGKVGRGLSGNEPNIVNGVQDPFSASRWNPPPPQSGLSVPPTPPVFGSPRNPQGQGNPFTRFNQAVDAEWSVENPMQPQQPNQLSAPKKQLGQGTIERPKVTPTETGGRKVTQEIRPSIMSNDARVSQERQTRFLESKGLTWEEVSNWERNKQDVLQEEYNNWDDNTGTLPDLSNAGDVVKEVPKPQPKPKRVTPFPKKQKATTPPIEKPISNNTQSYEPMPIVEKLQKASDIINSRYGETYGRDMLDAISDFKEAVVKGDNKGVHRLSSKDRETYNAKKKALSDLQAQISNDLPSIIQDLRNAGINVSDGGKILNQGGTTTYEIPLDYVGHYLKRLGATKNKSAVKGISSLPFPIRSYA